MSSSIKRESSEWGENTLGECLGIGIPHAPMFQFPDEAMANILKRRLASDTLSPHWKDVANWPGPMQQEWGTDEGLSAAKAHRDLVVPALRRVREELVRFDPDIVVVFGDDQYENFREDLVPTFCVYILDDMKVFPFRKSSAIGVSDNVWSKPEDHSVELRGNAPASLYIAEQLIGRGFDLAWSMGPHHHPTLSHAFMRTLLYLDYDQEGFPWGFIPFHVNAYGSDIAEKIKTPLASTGAPPAPSPSRCFELGEALGSVLRASPYRVAIVGSSSWSHGFLTKKNHYLWPDIESDRERLVELEASRQSCWADLSLEQLREAGQHEFLNWICMAGAMADATSQVLAFAPSWIFNSTKVVALLREDA